MAVEEFKSEKSSLYFDPRDIVAIEEPQKDFRMKPEEMPWFVYLRNTDKPFMFIQRDIGPVLSAFQRIKNND